MITPELINDMLEQQGLSARCLCIEVSPKHAIATLTPEATNIRPGGYISGPTLFAVADTALWFLTFSASERIEPFALTSELSIRFLHPAQGERVFARADLNKVSRRTVVGTVSVWTDANETPCATAQGTYVLP